jgi:hypothetical protein
VVIGEEEHVLGDVEGVVEGAAVAAGEAVDGPLVALHQPVEGGERARERAVDQLLVGRLQAPPSWPSRRAVRGCR